MRRGEWNFSDCVDAFHRRERFALSKAGFFLVNLQGDGLLTPAKRRS